MYLWSHHNKYSVQNDKQAACCHAGCTVDMHTKRTLFILDIVVSTPPVSLLIKVVRHWVQNQFILPFFLRIKIKIKIKSKSLFTDGGLLSRYEYLRMWWLAENQAKIRKIGKKPTTPLQKFFCPRCGCAPAWWISLLFLNHGQCRCVVKLATGCAVSCLWLGWAVGSVYIAEH